MKGFLGLIILAALAETGTGVPAYADPGIASAPDPAEPDNGPAPQVPVPLGDRALSVDGPDEAPSADAVEVLLPEKGPERGMGSAIAETMKDSQWDLSGAYVSLGEGRLGANMSVDWDLIIGGKRGEDASRMYARGAYGRIFQNVSELKTPHLLDVGAGISFPVGSFSMVLGGETRGTGRHTNAGIVAGVRMGDPDGNEIVASVGPGIAGISACGVSSFAVGGEISGSIRPAEFLSLMAAVKMHLLAGTSGQQSLPETWHRYSSNGLGSLLELEASLRLHMNPQSFAFLSAAYERSDVPVQVTSESLPIQAGGARTGEIRIGDKGTRMLIGAGWSF